MGSGGDDVGMLKGRLKFTCGDETTDVGHVHHQKRANFVANGAETGVVPVTGVRGGSADDELRTEFEGLLLKAVVIDVAGLGVQLVRKGLEKDGGSRNLLRRGVVAVGQMATMGKVQTHDAVMGLEESSVDAEIGGASRIRLDVDTPLLVAHTESFKGSLLAKKLNFVNVLVTTVVTGIRLALRVLVGKATTQALNDGQACEVFRGNQLDATPLAALLALDKIINFAISVLEALKSFREDSLHSLNTRHFLNKRIL
mmetsp:Transcript_18526/g.33684  ORF Transcript_18526/g.33684 Transcript_18526/m.33684 type:complete len:256 (-) Transcript_18526:42-809(-)